MHPLPHLLTSCCVLLAFFATTITSSSLATSSSSSSLSSSSSSSSSPGVSRELNIWLYTPTADNTTWAQWYQNLELHLENVTGVAPCTYLMDSTGEFTSQLPNASAIALARHWTNLMTTQLGLKTYPLLAASGTGMNLAIANQTLGAAFIADMINEATLVGFSGYNIQIEEPGNATIQQEWITYLKYWLDEFALHNLTLSIISGSICRGKDWMYMECGDYRVIAQNATNPRPNLHIIPEATYEGEPSAWKEYAQDLVHGLSSEVAHFGMSYVPPLTNPENGCLPLALSLNITSLYVWVNPPYSASGNASQLVWDAFGWWLTAPPPNTSSSSGGGGGGGGGSRSMKSIAAAPPSIHHRLRGRRRYPRSFMHMDESEKDQQKNKIKMNNKKSVIHSRINSAMTTVYPQFSLLSIGDWGGHGSSPFVTPQGLQVANGMANVYPTQSTTSSSAAAASAAAPTAETITSSPSSSTSASSIAPLSSTPSGVLLLGDNFYPLGICNENTFFTCNSTIDGRSGTEYDPRFQWTFENMFYPSALQQTLFYPLNGNHDALGNTTAELFYSNHSSRWVFPDLYYTLQWSLVPISSSSSSSSSGSCKVKDEKEAEEEETEKTMMKKNTSTSTTPTTTYAWTKVSSRPSNALLHISFIMLDVTLWWGVYSDPVHTQMGEDEWTWLHTTLPILSSTSDFLFLAGHYPLYSACAHGNVPYMIDNLLPLLVEYNVSAYFSGHDHCQEFLTLPIASRGMDRSHTEVEGGEEEEFPLFVTGTGDGCCYAPTNVDFLSPANLEFLLAGAEEYNPTNESGGFISLVVDTEDDASSFMSVNYHGANGTVLFVSPQYRAREKV